MSDSELFKNVPKTKFLTFIYEQDPINVKGIVDFLRLEKADVAKMCSVKLDSVRFDDRMPLDIRNRFIEIANLCELVAKHFEGDHTKTETWFALENPGLGNRSPQNLIKDGEHKKIMALLNDLPKTAAAPGAEI